MTPRGAPGRAVRARGLRRGHVPAVALALALTVVSAPAMEQPALVPSPGELLYSTHCGACHSTQIHWREKKLADDWPALVAQVRRWQGNLGLNWTETDIVDVARFLNERYYRFPGGVPTTAMARLRTGG